MLLPSSPQYILDGPSCRVTAPEPRQAPDRGYWAAGKPFPRALVGRGFISIGTAAAGTTAGRMPGASCLRVRRFRRGSTIPSKTRRIGRRRVLDVHVVLTGVNEFKRLKQRQHSPVLVDGW